MTGKARGSAPSESLAGLRSAAMGLVSYGWPVMRGTYFDGARWCGRPGTKGLSPVDDDWTTASTRSVSVVARWWASEPFSVLMACGDGVDCLEVPGEAGPRVLHALRAAGVRPPAMLTPVGTVVLFVRRGPRRALVAASLRSSGSWVAVPPTGEESGAHAAISRWVIGAAPGDVQGELPELPAVREVLASAVSGMATAPGAAMRPRRASIRQGARGGSKDAKGEASGRGRR